MEHPDNPINAENTNAALPADDDINVRVGAAESAITSALSALNESPQIRIGALLNLAIKEIYAMDAESQKVGALLLLNTGAVAGQDFGLTLDEVLDCVSEPFTPTAQPLQG